MYLYPFPSTGEFRVLSPIGKPWVQDLLRVLLYIFPLSGYGVEMVVYLLKPVRTVRRIEGYQNIFRQCCGTSRFLIPVLSMIWFPYTSLGYIFWYLTILQDPQGKAFFSGIDDT
jgi:hypothetical protein